jgi:hypothetical protein
VGLCIMLEVNFREIRLDELRRIHLLEPLRRAPRVGQLRLRGSEHTRDYYVLRVGLGCASALAQERHDVLGKSLRDKDVSDVLLALKHCDPGVGQRGRNRLDVRFGWV